MLSNKNPPRNQPSLSGRWEQENPAPISSAASAHERFYRGYYSWDGRPLFRSSLGGLTPRHLTDLAAHVRVHTPDVLPVAIARLADHRIVDAVAQDLLGRLKGEVARVTWRAQVLHHVLGHRLKLLIVALNLGWPILVELAPAHLRLHVVGVHLPEIIGDAAVPGEPYHRVYRLVRGRRLVERPDPGDADAVVQAVVDVVVGAHRVRERVQDPEKGAGECLGRYVLRPNHAFHRLVVVRVVGRVAQVPLYHLDGLQCQRRAREVLHPAHVRLGGVRYRVEPRKGDELRGLRHTQKRVVNRQRCREGPVGADPLVRSLRGG